MSSADEERSRPYHHGDLRAVLLRAAAHEIQATGAVGLSLRHVARRAGVSHAAPAYHFGSKRGLYTALAAEGFRILHESTAPALDGEEALVVAGRRYVEFALDHPAHFAVMFDASLLDHGDAVLERERATAFEVLHQAIRRATGATDEDELVRQTLAAWLVVHGAATLWLSGNLPYERDAGLVGQAFADLAPALARIVQASTR